MSSKYDVLVGFDGSVEAKDALAWAVAEARSRNAGLTVVYVCEAAAYGLWTTTRTIRGGLRKLNRPVVDEALFEARRLDPDLFVRGRVVLGSPSRTLVSMSARSQLIVVGRQGKGALAAHLLGSVSQRLMVHAHCPVVVVSHPLEGGPADVVDRVVLAVGDPPIAGNALRSPRKRPAVAKYRCMRSMAGRFTAGSHPVLRRSCLTRWPKSSGSGTWWRSSQLSKLIGLAPRSGQSCARVLRPEC
jgi:nucleotide-binding universal stress UspA family protein